MACSTFNIGGADITPPSFVPCGGLGTLETYLQRIIPIFLFAGVCLVLIYIVWGGIQWSMSGGDKSKLTAARAKVTWAIIGFIVLLSSYAIIGVVGYFFKVDLLKLA